MSAVLTDKQVVNHAVPLANAVEFNPKPHRDSMSADLEVSFVPMAAVEAGSGRMDSSQVRPYSEVKTGFTYFRDGDVLFAKITPCMENGKMAVAHGLRNGIGFGSTEFHVLRPCEGVDARYVYHFVSSAGFRREAAHHMTGAVGQKRVPLAFLQQSALPLPPIHEQREIVAEIEKQFSRLDEAISNLLRVKAHLRRYRDCVLREAVQGKLVPNQAILARRSRKATHSGEDALRDWLAIRKANGGSQTRLSQPQELRSRNLPLLPEGWAWASATQACERVVDCHNKTAPYLPAGIPLVRTTNIRNGALVRDGLRYVDEPTYRFWSRRCPPLPGDVLFTREAPMGEAAIVPDGMTVCLGQRTMLLRPSPILDKKFLLAALMSPVVKALLIFT